MLGCRPTCEGPGAFSSSVSLPLARRHELANNPAVAEAGARTFSNSLCAFTAFRKRPGCLTESSNLSSRHEQPLDLSLPKLKVRHHWSGGSIVQINDTTAQTAAHLSQCRCCCTSNNCCSCSSSSKRIPSRQLSIATTVQPSLEWFPTAKASSQSEWISQPVLIEHPHRTELTVSQTTSSETETLTSPVGPTPVSKASRHRIVTATTTTTTTTADCNPHLHLQVRIPIIQQLIEIDSRPLATEDIQPLVPLNVVPNENDPLDKLKIFLRQKSNDRKLTSAGLWPHPQVEHVMEDDLRRLTDSLHQLQMSGYYYGGLSWQESLQLLQGTQVGTFLIRDSSDSRYLYALSIQTERGPTSVRIHYVNGTFQLDADSRLMGSLPTFQSVLRLIDFYVSEWKQCGEKGQVWLDNNGQVYSPVFLRKPLLKECSSLQHLCRLSWNRLPNEKRLHWEIQGTIPHTVQAYLREYPFKY